ncbi:GNAT family N-acetyltransferase [Flavimaricola marinus]|uniref:Acetyltransferase (GNAT) family protein n=1 Tax=Flavimaricola marinus TaxID=1819565 RepID=A0A238LHX9_9RHOB|nr:GNAT family N-acetyltransferase [Flavimaricola marinus]SMY08566.1 Acetyltransferase (GNAT) family protein [Flavimaricola marinus]
MTAPDPKRIGAWPKLRPSNAGDIERIDRLLRQSYPRLLKPDYPPSVLVTAIPLIARAQPDLIKCGTYYVAEDRDGAIVGAGGWTQSIPGAGGREPGRGNIRHVVTDHSRVRQGIGRALMAHTLASARSEGMTWMHCVSTRTAVPFYASLGFTAMGEVSIPIGPAGIGFPAVEMRCDL